MSHPAVIRRRVRFGVCASAAMLLWTATASADPAKTLAIQGYELGEVQSPRAVAMGGFLYALGTSTTSLYSNPANMPVARMYHFEALASYSPEASRQSYGGAIVDSVTNRLSGGVAYDWTQLDPSGVQREWHDVRVGAAYPLGDIFSVGLIGRYISLTQPPARGPFGASIVSDGTATQPLLNTVTFDAGMTLALGQNIRVAAIGQNLTNMNTSLLPVVAGGGVGFLSRMVSLEADAAADLTSWATPKLRMGLGGELFVFDHLAFRAGYRYEGGLSINGLSGGLGYIDRRWSAEAGLRREVNGPHPMTMMSISVRFFYDGGRSTDAVDEPSN